MRPCDYTKQLGIRKPVYIFFVHIIKVVYTEIIFEAWKQKKRKRGPDALVLMGVCALSCVFRVKYEMTCYVLFVKCARSMTERGRMPFVLLRKSVDTKAPAFKNWVDGVTEEQVLSWLSEGGGVGLALHLTTSWVIDFDHLSAPVHEVAEIFGQAGSLVNITPRGGLHIFLKAPAPVESGRYVIFHNDVELGVADVYSPPSPRNIVLPIAGTPRDIEGGGVLWEGCRRLDGYAVSFATMQEYLKYLKINYKGLPDGIRFLPAERAKKEGAPAGGRWNTLLGKDWRHATQEDLCEAMRRAREGERHNTLLSISALWAVRNFGDSMPLRRAAIEAWGDDRGAEKEIDNILGNISEVPGKLEHFEKIQSAADGKENKRRSWGKSRQSPEEWLRAVFPEGVQVAFIGGDVYLLCGGYAVNIEGLRSIAAARGVSIGKDKAEVIMGYAAAKLPVVQGVHIVRNWPSLHDGRLCVYAEIEGRRGILAAKAGIFNFIELGESSAGGMCVMYTDRPRPVCQVDIVGASQAADEFIQVTCALLRTGDRAVACAVAALCSGAARGGFVVMGNPGCGKSTFSLFMQHIAQGEGGFTSPADPRSFIASCANSSVIGIDESDTLSSGVQDMLKTLISYGTVNVRKMYTNAGLEQLQASVSVVLSSVEVHHLASDLMRRMAVLRITKKPEVRVSEDEILPLIREGASRYMIGCMYLCANGKINNNNNSLLSILKNNNTNLPDFLSSDSKRDWAEAYHAACRRAGVTEEESRRVWQTIRGEARALGLGKWADVLEAIKGNNELGHMLADGMTAQQIAEVIIGCDTEEEVQRCARSLAQTALRAATALEEMGWVVEKRKVKNKLMYRLAKLDNNNGDNNRSGVKIDAKANSGMVQELFSINEEKDKRSIAHVEDSYDTESVKKISAFVSGFPENQRGDVEAILREAYLRNAKINDIAAKLGQQTRYVIEVMNSFNIFLSKPHRT